MKSSFYKSHKRSSSFKINKGSLYISANNAIVLCTQDSNDNFRGVVIHAETTAQTIGSYSEFWAIDCFTKFEGTVILED